MSEALNICIVDDEQYGLEALEYDLSRVEPNAKLRMFTDPYKALESIQSNPPDVLFLDIEMPSMNGFELLDRLDTSDIHVIFVTAFDHYAITAFRYFALDYLLKPVEIDVLKSSMSRLKQRRIKRDNQQIDALLHQMKMPEATFDKLAIPTRDEIEFIEFDNIIRCQADNNYTEIHKLDKSKTLASKGLNHFHDLLEQHGFFRVHKSHLINLKYIKRYVKSDGGYIEMKDGSIVSLSRAKRKAFAALIAKYQ